MKPSQSMLQIDMSGTVVEVGNNANGQYRIWGDGTIQNILQKQGPHDPPTQLTGVSLPIAHENILSASFSSNIVSVDGSNRSGMTSGARVFVSAGVNDQIEFRLDEVSGVGQVAYTDIQSVEIGTPSTRAHLFDPNATYERFINKTTLAMKFSNPLVPDHLYIDPLAVPSTHVAESDYPQAAAPASAGNEWVWDVGTSDFVEQAIPAATAGVPMPDLYDLEDRIEALEAEVDGGTY